MQVLSLTSTHTQATLYGKQSGQWINTDYARIWIQILEGQSAPSVYESAVTFPHTEEKTEQRERVPTVKYHPITAAYEECMKQPYSGD